MSIGSVNWFDVCVLLIVGIGCWRGYYKGASEQLLPLAAWWGTVWTAAYTHRTLGRLLGQSSGMHPAVCHAVAYVLEVAVAMALLAWLSRMTTERIVAAQLFGRIEHPLGSLFGGLSATAAMLLTVALLSSFDLSPSRRWLKANPDDPSFRALALTVAERVHRDVAVESVWAVRLRRHVPNLLPTPVAIGQEPRPAGVLEERRKLIDRAGQQP